MVYFNNLLRLGDRLRKPRPMNKLLKKIAFALLPESILQKLRLFHYQHTVSQIDEVEEKSLFILKHLIGAGDFVIDAGANIGVYTYFFSSLVGAKGRVVAIEPIPTTFQILTSNVRAHKLANVTAFNVALSDVEKTVSMVIPVGEHGGENIYRARIEEQSQREGRKFSVTAQPLDRLLETLPYPVGSKKIDVIKIDVEGAELQCIRGALQIITRDHPALLIEVSDDPDDLNSDAFQLFSILSNVSYEPYGWDGNILKKRCKQDAFIDYFFLMPQHIEMLRGKGVPIG